MATASSNSNEPVLFRPRNFQWYWNSASDPWSDEKQWRQYTDVENEIIEDAFDANKSEVEIDGNYIIDLAYQLQYNKLDKSDARQIERVQLTEAHNNVHLREERFSSPVDLASASVASSEALSNQVRACLNCSDFPSAYYYQELENKIKTITDVVQAAADGILKEGMALGKDNEAKWLAEKLLLVKHHGSGNKASLFPTIPLKICKACVYLYTKDSFWYQLLNATLRNLEAVTPEQVKTFGPFCWLLQGCLKLFLPSKVFTVYRGLTIEDDQRQAYMKKEMTFTSFTSTTKNRDVAEMYGGNTLLIMDVNVIEYRTGCHVRYGADISKLSAFRDEEEYLFSPTAIFDFVEYKYDSEKKKHIIYLKVAAKNC